MKKSLFAMLLAIALVMVPLMSLAEEAFNPEGLIDWFNESYGWMTVANGHWSSDPADRITREELDKIFEMATKQQNAVHWTPYFFIVVEDVEEQRKIIGDAWGDPNDMATEGTVTVLVMCDQLLSEEEGHVTPYEGYYMQTPKARYDAGLTCGLLGVAAASLGYNTHYFGTINGEYAPKDIAGQYQSLSRYVKDEYQRVWGFRNAYNGEISEETKFPVAGNCIFIDAIVIGKPAAGETVETWGTNHARPQIWAYWDGVPNEKPSPAAAVKEDAAIELGENEYLGVGTGKGGAVKVKVTVADGKLTAVEVVEHTETPGFFEPAVETIPAAIVEAQSAQVDVVAGATATSNAIMTAVADAMAQAGL